MADDITLGSTLLFYTKETEKPVRFVAPSFAKDITTTSIPIKRVIRSGDSGCHYWWIEWGGELDTVHENERIRDELWSVIYGIWDYIKNSGEFEADHMTLEWVGSIPGKREYRRFLGDSILTQNDVIAQRSFEDRVAFGGWSIDLHPPQGMYATESGSKHLHMDGIYHIPFGSLYSRNVSNLLFAGRNISATHVAFGTTRVMATCAVMGEAAGVGAALSVMKRITPRELRERYLSELQQTMLRTDASIIGLRNEDVHDLAKKGVVSASSTMKGIRLDNAAQEYRLISDVGLLFPADGEVEGLRILVTARETTQLNIELWDTGRDENYVPANHRQTLIIEVAAGEKQWLDIPADRMLFGDKPCNGFVIVRANEAASLFTSEVPLTGVLAFERGAKPVVSSDLEDHQPDQLVIEWSMRGLVRKPFCFAVETSAYSADKVVSGYVRPYGGPQMWVSEPLVNGQVEWVEVELPERADIREIHLTFNNDVNEDLINLHHHETPFLIIPELVKAYELQAYMDGEWVTVAGDNHNRTRKKIHRFEEPIPSNRIRVVIKETNGSERAEVIEIRIYEVHSIEMKTS